jgi:murein DD-endopeptidase MepM/ murein hydrolase activator NlpD
MRLAVVVLAASLLLLGSDGVEMIPSDFAAAVDRIQLASTAPVSPPPPDPAAIAEAEAEAQRARWTAELSTDHWVHPLAGPKRRMPVRLSRVFGAGRPGHRPLECQAGHCGVDLGGEVWGEPVLAAHPGVVERVQRDPDRGRGGMYVRLSHRGGTVFTQYFHLAAIPRALSPGDEVEAGEVIGLLGATGIVHSEAHLHFTVSVRSSGDGPEQYIDPEPLIALWPVAVPVFGDVGSIARTHTIPGHPRGPYGKRKRKARAAVKPRLADPAPQEDPADEARVEVVDVKR